MKQLRIAKTFFCLKGAEIFAVTVINIHAPHIREIEQGYKKLFFPIGVYVIFACVPHSGREHILKLTLAFAYKNVLFALGDLGLVKLAEHIHHVFGELHYFFVKDLFHALISAVLQSALGK